MLDAEHAKVSEQPVEVTGLSAHGAGQELGTHNFLRAETPLCAQPPRKTVTP